MEDEYNDSFLIQHSGALSDSCHSQTNIVDMLLADSSFNETKAVAHPNVLSQVVDDQNPICAGQIETRDGQILPIGIGQTDIGNGKPRPYIHISDDPSVLSRHVTITTVQTKDGKFRAMLRVNHPHAKVLLGGSLIRPETMYAIADDDEIVVGDGVCFRLRLNNTAKLGYGGRRESLDAPTPFYVPAPNSDEIHESEEKEKEEKRRNFRDRLTPPNEDSILFQLAAAADSEGSGGPITLVHQPADTLPYSSDSSGSKSQIPMASNTSDASVAEFMATDPDDAMMTQAVLSQPMSGVSETPVQAGETPMPPRVDMPELPEVPDVPEMPDQEVPVSNEEPITSDGVVVPEQPAVSDMPSEDPVRAPQLSQAHDEMNKENEPVVPSPTAEVEMTLMERVRRKRISELGKKDVEVKEELSSPGMADESAEKRPKRQRKPSVEEPVVAEKVRPVSARSSGRNSSESVSGPSRLVFLKTAIELDKQTETAVAAAGGKFESKWSDRVEALVTGSIVRTTKFLCAINKGLAIFPKSILTEIKVNKRLPPTTDSALWLNDPVGEEKYGFSLKEALLSARRKPVLSNFEVYCFKNGIGEFTSEELKDLITTAGGKQVSRLPKIAEGEDDNGGVILIGAEINTGAARNTGAKYFNKIEFLVNACLKQTIDFSIGRIDL